MSAEPSDSTDDLSGIFVRSIHLSASDSDCNLRDDDYRGCAADLQEPSDHWSDPVRRFPDETATSDFGVVGGRLPRLYCRGEQPRPLLKAVLKALSDS